VTSRAAVVYAHKNETIDVITSKEADKIPKYKYLTIEIQCLWKVKTKVIAVTNNRGDWDCLKVIQKIREQP